MNSSLADAAMLPECKISRSQSQNSKGKPHNAFNAGVKHLNKEINEFNALLGTRTELLVYVVAHN